VSGDHGTPQDRFGELSCARILTLVTDYLEGVLPEPLRARFEEHLSYCPPCREYLAQMRTTIRLTGRLTESDVPPETMDALMRAFRDQAHG
jgi:predicted anti-sigma-YlaC factor YlaD